MKNFNSKEYNTVILAALLHDIGKFIHRAIDAKYHHAFHSALFVEDERFRTVVDEDWVDLKLLKVLVQHHHEDPKMGENFLVQKIEEPHIRSLAYIVSRADSYSSGERITEEPSVFKIKDTRLMSVFSRVDIGKGEPEKRHYNLQRLAPENVFPVREEDLAYVSHSYEDLQKEFGQEFKKLKPRTFDGLYNGLLSIFEEFLWCVPSYATDRYADVSLYDHLSTTSAISACLYLYHNEKGDFTEECVTNDELERCMLVGGDLSGIQSFIFDIGSTNPKKLSKTLRGRSFYLGLLTDVASLKILSTLNLPLSCRVMSAGGRFILLVPNTESVRSKLNELKDDITSWFYTTFLGKLSLNISWDVTLGKQDFTCTGFLHKYKELSYKLEVAKRKKMEGIFLKGLSFMMEPLKKAHFALQKDGEPCEFCKVYPKKENESRCNICIDSARIGESIPIKPFIFFYDKSLPKGISILGYTVSFDELDSNWILKEKIGFIETKENDGYVKKCVSNHVPKPQQGDIDLKVEKPEDGESLCRYCSSRCKLKGDKSQNIPDRADLTRAFLTFQCISAFTPKCNEGKGVDHLAIIKADVDDLGVIFSEGLREFFSISRYANLSRMLHYFFSGWLTHDIRTNHRMVYTVYAGGDDLFLIAPWEIGIELGRKIGKEFHRYTGHNPNVTISMGINLMRPGSPVGLAVKVAEDNLKRSKNEKQKKSITLFGTTCSWDDLEELVEYMEFLNKYLRDETEKKFNMSFMYRLLTYHQMYFRYYEGLKKNSYFVEGLRFHSLMARDIVRNIERRDKSGKVLNEHITQKLLPLYETGSGFNEKLMINLKIPLFWTIYKNRGGRT